LAPDPTPTLSAAHYNIGGIPTNIHGLGDRPMHLNRDPTKPGPFPPAARVYRETSSLTVPTASRGRAVAFVGLGGAGSARYLADRHLDRYGHDARRDADLSREMARLTAPLAWRSHSRLSALYAPPAEKTQHLPIGHLLPRRPRRRHARDQQSFEVL
jgi:hypothetical protein